MSKNKKVIFASVGIFLALILSVLLIRSPGPQKAPDPPKKIEATAPATDSKPKEMDDSQKKVSGIIDDASSEMVKQAPGLWNRVTDTWKWFMGFDAQHAIILLAVMVIVTGIMISGGKKNRNQH